MRDPTRHYCECVCLFSVENHTGLLLLRDILASQRTTVVTDEIMALYLETAQKKVDLRRQAHDASKAA